MPSLKDLKNRIASVKSTQKITSAMKMVAASKLRRAQEQAEASRPYAERMARVLASVATNVQSLDSAPKLVQGTGSDSVHLLVVISSDRGLCGGFNTAVVREARRQIQSLQGQGKTVKVITVGRKGRDNLRRDYSDLIEANYEDLGRRRLSFAEADTVARKILDMFEAGEYDVCSLIYNKFKSVIAQIVTVQQIVPLSLPQAEAPVAGAPEGDFVMSPEFEPSEEAILEVLVPRNLSIQVYGAILESAASEQGARMTAMDNATRNAGDMITRLTLNYNRTRQAVITKELIEIISGAEAL
jgi:F-type H+-transporting ATPase subunit gamma